MHQQEQETIQVQPPTQAISACSEVAAATLALAAATVQSPNLTNLGAEPDFVSSCRSSTFALRLSEHGRPMGRVAGERHDLKGLGPFAAINFASQGEPTRFPGGFPSGSP